AVEGSTRAARSTAAPAAQVVLRRPASATMAARPMAGAHDANANVRGRSTWPRTPTAATRAMGTATAQTRTRPSERSARPAAMQPAGTITTTMTVVGE